MQKFNSEGDVKKEIKKLLKLHDWFTFMPSAGPFGKSGISDHLCVKGGMFMAIEAKHGKNGPSTLQQDFLRRVAAAGGMAFVVNETRLGWLAVFLKAYDRVVDARTAGREIEAADEDALLKGAKAMTHGFF